MKIFKRTSFFILIRLIFIFTPQVELAEEHFLKSIADTIIVKDWLYAGPFSVGVREGITGLRIDPQTFIPYEGLEHPDILVPGGIVRWQKTQADSQGNVELKFENVLWDSIQDYYGAAGVLNLTYAYAEFDYQPELSSGQARALVIAEKIGRFYLNGKPYTSDHYGHDYVLNPVIIEPGKNRIFLSVSGFGDRKFLFKIIPVPLPLLALTKDATLPDIIEGEILSSYLAVPILNATERRLLNVEVSIGDDKLFKLSRTRLASFLPTLVQKVPLELIQLSPIKGVDTIRLPLTIRWQDVKLETLLTLRVRKANQSRKETFISEIDKSCQYYAVLPPKDFNPAKTYSLILSTHGAGVEAIGQADAYEQKDWAFVVCPTNRRRFGFDWQDWGRLDALEVLKNVLKRYPIDTNRVYLTGHSMGGHGVWHIGLAHPDLFAALAPEAGWTYIQLYIPWFLQKSNIFGEPEQLMVRDKALREDFTLNYLENARNLPVFILHGALDDNVPPLHGRIFAKYLANLGYEYRYKEVPEKGHWWTGCLDDTDLMNFIKEKKRDPWPKEVVFKTNNIGQSNKSYWLRLLEQKRLYSESEIRAKVKENLIEVKTKNIKSFAINLSPNLVPYGKITILIDGTAIRHNFKEEGEFCFIKKDRHWTKSRISNLLFAHRKRPGFYGPIKEAYYSPFVLVYGTKSDSQTTDLTLTQARQESWLWWIRGNGLSPVLADTEVTQEIIDNYNLILFGGPEENFLTERCYQKGGLPIRISNGSIKIGKKEFADSNLATIFIYPNPLNRRRFILLRAGTDYEGLRLSNFFGVLHSSSGLPDFMVYSPAVREKGWAGVIGAGFFNTDWQISPELSYIKE